MSAAAGAEVEVLDSRHLGGAWTLDQIWERLGIGAAMRRAAASRRRMGRRSSGSRSRWSPSAPWSGAASWPARTGLPNGS